MFTKTDYELLKNLLVEYGMDHKRANMFAKKMSDDEREFCIDSEQRKWALQRGFYPGRIILYGLNEDNYSDYLSDFAYYMMHPINHHFRIWVNDKLTLKYILNSCECEDTMPKYYVYIENNGEYTYLMDAPENLPKNENFLVNLLKQQKFLAVKPNSGTSGGLGFMKWEWHKDRIFVNNKEISKGELKVIVAGLQNYLVSEYIHQHNDLRKFWADSECTLRVTMAKLPRENVYDAPKWHNVVSYARFGSSISGGASNLISGGIGVAFDFETGRFNESGVRYKGFCNDGNYICYKHPDTHAIWGRYVLPNWEFVKCKIKHVCHHISSLDYLGFDIIITQEGMKFCEINTHPAADYEQVMCNPILKDIKAKIFFEKHGLNNIKVSDLYDIYMKCQL